MRIHQLPASFRGALCQQLKGTFLTGSTGFSYQNQRLSLTRLYSQDHVGDTRARLSKFWIPTGGIAANEGEDIHAKLIRAGFLRQAHSGIFHMLPLGRRVQAKVEKLIDFHMASLGASRLDLSSLSSEELWARSGRLGSAGELFRFKDRKEAGYLLAPTHEEEITTLVASTVKSYKDLPVRLYQISRKYRDELRPRHGLLRSREFIMKDLYTFDVTAEQALVTYHAVRKAYANLFDELKIPYLVAEADSGDIGGDLSHEFHFATSKGEDHIINCTSCDYVANEELAESRPAIQGGAQDAKANMSIAPIATRAISRDRKTLIKIWYMPSDDPSQTPEVNIHAIKAILPEFDASVENPENFWPMSTSPTSASTPTHLINLIDSRIPPAHRELIISRGAEQPLWPSPTPFNSLGALQTSTLTTHPTTNEPLNLLRIQANDACPRCPSGQLAVQKCIELGHTFHLGTRYSTPLKAHIRIPSTPGLKDTDVPMQMGCHGIGVSRMIAAVADTLSDHTGLHWPRVLAPFEVAIIAHPKFSSDADAATLYDACIRRGLDAVLDDRAASFAWKMNDAELIGYPVVVVLGKKWRVVEGEGEGEQQCEVQCRRLGIRESVSRSELETRLPELLARL